MYRIEFVEFLILPIAPLHKQINNVMKIKNILKSITNDFGIRNVTALFK